jgi:hypothetical protein
MSESQGKSDPQNTKEAPSKRDNKNPKARDILSSVSCLRGYLAGIAEKRWESPITKLNKIHLNLLKLYKPLIVTPLLFFAIFIIMILFLKLTETIPTTLIEILLKIIVFILVIISVIVLAIIFYIASIEYVLYFIIPIFGFRGLIRILPALIDELKGKLPKDVEEDAQKYIKKYPCMERFRGNATEALSRIGQSTFFLMLINLIFSSFFILSLLFLVIGSIYLLGLKTSLISITSIERVVTKTVVDIALWVLGTILTITIGLFLFSSQAKFDVNTLRFVYDVKFTVLEWFIVAMILIIISMMMRPFIAVFIMVPIIIALIISINVYIILASAVLDYMQLP